VAWHRAARRGDPEELREGRPRLPPTAAAGFYIKVPEIFPDKLTPLDRITTLKELPENTEVQRYILEKELELPPDIVEKIINNEVETQERNARAAARGLADRMFGPQDDEEADDEETVEGQKVPALTAPQTARANNGAGGATAQ
jgi:hypothetical protein